MAKLGTSAFWDSREDELRKILRSCPDHPLAPRIRVILASLHGRGARLTASEVWELANIDDSFGQPVINELADRKGRE